MSLKLAAFVSDPSGRVRVVGLAKVGTFLTAFASWH